MPYINRPARRDFEWMFHPEEHYLVEKGVNPARPQSPGELNYVISRIIDNYIYDTSPDGEALSYTRFNDVMGVLTCIQHEYYRRLIGTYETLARMKSGEVFCHTDTMLSIHKAKRLDPKEP